MSGCIQSVISLAASFVGALRLMDKMHCRRSKTLWSYRDLLPIRNGVEGWASLQGRGLLLGLWSEALTRALGSGVWPRPSSSFHVQLLVGVSLLMLASLCSSTSAGSPCRYSGPAH